MAKQLNVNLGFTADTSQAKRQLQELQQSLTKLTTSSIKSNGNLGITKELTSAISAVNELKIKLEQATTSTGTLDLGKFNQSLQQSNKNIQTYANNLKALGPEGAQAFSQLSRAITTAEVPLKQTNTLLTEFATTLKNTTRWQLSSSLLHGFIGSIQSAVGYAKDLDASLNNIRIVTGQSADQMAAFAERANKAAQELSTTTTAYTDAALIFYQQGLDDSAVEERTNATIKMAHATGDAAEEVSSYMTAIWNNFDDGSESLEHYADVITALGASTASSSSEIASGLSQFAAIAQTTGLSYEYATSALATLVANTRQSADTIGNSLKTIFSRLQGLSLGDTLEDGTNLNKYSKALQTVGVDIKDANGNLRDMDSILDDLSGKWGNLEQAEKMALAQTVAGTRQYTQLISLMDNWDDMKKNLNTAGSSEGALNKQAQTYAESWKAARDEVKAAAEGIYKDLLNPDMFKEFLNIFTILLNSIDTLIDGLGGLKGILPIISTLLLNTFGSDLSNSIDTFIYNLKLGTEVGRQEIEQLRNDTIQAMRDMYDNGSISGSARVDIFQSQANLQDALLSKTRELQQANSDLTEEERKQAQTLLDINAALGDEYLKITANLEQQNKKTEASKTQLLGLVEKDDRSNVSNKMQDMSINANSWKVAAGLVATYKKEISSIKNKNIEEQSDAVKKLSETFANLLSSSNKTAAELNSGVLNTLKKIGEAGGDVTKIESAFKELEEAAIQSSKQFGEQKKSLASLFESMGYSSADYAPVLNEYAQQLQETGSLTEEQIATFARFGIQVDKTGRVISSFSGTMQTMGSAITSGVQALSTFGMGLSQASNFGEQFSNAIFGGGSKLQAFIAFTMAAGTAIRTFNTVMEAQKTITQAITALKEKENAVTLSSIVAEKAHNAAAIVSNTLMAAKAATLNLAQVAMGKMTLSEYAQSIAIAFNTTEIEANTMAWYSNPILALVAVALLAVVTVIKAVSSALENQNKKLHENADAAKEASDETYKQVQTNEELVKSYESALKKYKETGEGKEELDSISKQLAETYEVENEALLIQQGRYEDLTKAINDKKLAELEAAKTAIETSQAEAGKAFVSDMRKDEGHYSGDHYTLDFDNGTGTAQWDKDEKAIGQAFDKLNDSEEGLNYISKPGGGDIRLTTGKGYEEMMAGYEEVLALTEEARKQAQELYGSEATAKLEDSELYQDMMDWLEKGKESYDSLKELEAQYEDVNIQEAIARAMQSIDIDPTEIESLEEYNQLVEEAVQKLVDSGMDEADAREAINAKFGLSDDILAQWSQLDAAMSDASTMTGIAKEDLNKFYEGLTDDQKAVFMSLNFDSAKSIEDLERQLGVLQARADQNEIQVQLAAVQNAKSDLKEGMSAQELKDFQTSSGIDWGSQEHDIIEYSQFLSMSYAQQTEYLNNLESNFQSKLTNATASVIQEDSALVEKYQADLEIAQQTLINAESALDALKSSGDATDEEMKQAEQAVTDTQAEVDNLTTSIKNLNTEIENSEEELKIQVVLDDAEIGAQMGSAESLDELRNLAGQYGSALTDGLASDGTGIGDSSYDEYANGLLNIATKYESCSQAAEQYQNALNALNEATDENREAAEKQVEVAQDQLESMIGCEEAAKKYSLEADTLAAQMQEIANAQGVSKKEALALAVANERMNKGVASLVNNWDDWKKMLNSTENTAEDYAATLADVSDAVQDLVGWYEDLNLDSEFVADNMGLIDKAAAGDVTAILELGAAVASYEVAQAELNTTLAEGQMASGEDNALIQYMNSLDEATTAAEAFTAAQTGVQAGFEAIRENLDALQNNTMSLTDVLGGEAGLQEWVAQLNAYAAATGMTAEEMQQMLASVGVTANVQSDYQEQEVTVPTYRDEVTDIHYEQVPFTRSLPDGGVQTGYDEVPEYTRASVPGEPLTTTGFVEVASISMDGEGEGPSVSAPKFTGKQAPSNTAKTGGTGNRPRSSSGSRNRGSGGSGTSTRSRSNKQKIKHREIEDDLKELKDEKERYHEIELAIDDVNDKVEQYSALADRAFGKSKVKMLREQAKALKELAKDYRKELEENQQYLEQDKTTAESYGWQFDNQGNVKNYDEKMAALVKKYNTAVEQARNEKNSAIEWWNNLTGDEQDSETNKDKFEQLTEDAEYNLKKAEELYQDSIDALKQYEETKEKREDLIKAQREALEKALDAEIEAVDVVVQVKLDIDDADIKYLEELLDNLGDGADTFVDQLGLMGSKVEELGSKAEISRQGLKDLLGVYTDGSLYNGVDNENGVDLENSPISKDLVSKIMSGGQLDQDDINDLYNAGFTDDTISKMQEYVDNLYDINGELRDLKDEALQKTIDAFNEFTDELDRNSEGIEHLQKVTETYKNIIDIVGKKVLDANGELTNQLNRANFNMQRNNTHALKSELDMIDSSVAAMKEKLAELQADNANGQHNEAIKKMEEQLKEMTDKRNDTYESWLDSWEAEMQAAADIYADTLEQIVDDFSKSIAGAAGTLNQLAEEFERKSEVADIYVDDYEKIYNLSKLTRDIEKSIDDTDNIKSKKALKGLMEEIERLQESGAKLSEYDLENLRKQYELELAKQQLTESQEAKSTVRMTRDSEGNYGYVYTADENAVANAEQNYEDKLYAMQKANADYINELQNNIISAEQACADALAELDASQFASYEEYQTAVAQIQEDYNELMNGYFEQINTVLDNNKDLYNIEWQEYNNMTGYKISADENYIDSFNETTYSLLTNYENLEDAQDAWVRSVQDATNEAAEAWFRWYEDNQIALSDGETSMQEYGSTVEEVTETVLDLGQEMEESAQSLSETYVDSFSEILDSLQNFSLSYDGQIQKIIESNNQLTESINKVIRSASDLADATDSSGDTITSSSSSSSSSSSDGYGFYGTGNSTSRSSSRSSSSSSRSSSKSSSKSSSSSGSKASWSKGYAAYQRINAGAWGNGVQNRIAKGAAEGYTEAEVRLGQQIINYTYPVSDNGKGYSLEKAKKLLGYDTGGYTGKWGNSNGKLALLHEKELVLNAEDTENFLKAVDIIRDISQTIDLNALSASNNLATMLQSTSTVKSEDSQILEQEVHITADFSGVKDHSEIETAFDNLINRAAQFANRKN